jgi:hypothetical protein
MKARHLVLTLATVLVFGLAEHAAAQSQAPERREPSAAPGGTGTSQMPHPMAPGGQGHMMMCPMMMGGGGMMGGGMMGSGMMGSGTMGMPMMGGSTDPKTMGRMLQMRGEMMKAIGDIMMKHGKAMESGQP